MITELILRPAAPPLRYPPGQYVLLGDPAAELVVRSYSITNEPRRDGLISPPVTPVPGGQLSPWVHDVLRPGDRVLLSAPYGSSPFTCVRGPGAGGPRPAGRIPMILAGWFPDLPGWRVYIAGAAPVRHRVRGGRPRSRRGAQPAAAARSRS